MKKRHRIFIYAVVGSMIFSAFALSLLVLLGSSDNDNEEAIVVDNTSLQDNAELVPDFEELGIEDITVGQGEALILGDVITVNYNLSLSDGTAVPGNDTFVSGQPATFTFQLGSLIEGWTTGLVGMQEGGTRRLEIPSALGYGAVGSAPYIPGNAGLIFEVELLEIKS